MADAIFIVGYYRSGTSALSGALQRSGVKFYNEATPNEHNPLGFFEIPELIEFDARLFAHLGVDWPDVRGLPEGWTDRADIAPFAAQLEEIVRRRFLPQDRLWGLKHPHLCRTLPLYERTARRAGHTPHIIHIFRDPWISAASQCYKNGLSRAHALLLWLSYATNAERQARHLPRTWLTYSDLLADPIPQLRRIESELGLTLQENGGDDLAEAGAYLTNQLDRSKPLPREQLCRPLEDLVERTWQAILARQFDATRWDDFSAETADLVGFLSEIGSSKASALPAFGNANAQMAGTAAADPVLRPSERTDTSTRQVLERLRAEIGPLPEVDVVIVAPPERAHAVTETLESLHKQWEAPALITILTADTLALDDMPIIQASAEPEAITAALCAYLNQKDTGADYVAILNAGDTITPDACLRFALLAAQTKADMLYSDEIVAGNGNLWIRYKPGWDITRLRQSAYIGDWVWYGRAAMQAAGGFNPAMAGAEEYDLQLRLAGRNARVERLPEAVFTRSGQSKRDNITPAIFCARAITALGEHLRLGDMPAEVQNRQYPGLFHHMRLVADPGTSIIMLCDGAEIPILDKWLTALLTGAPLTGPVILAAGADISSQMQTYLTAVANQHEALQGQVLAVMAPSPGEAVAKALALATTELVAFLDARMQDVTPHWQEQLRARLADQSVAAVAARTITPVGHDGRQGEVVGPIILGAATRLGTGHGPLDPGPGGWLTVDQEVSAFTPPGILARRAALARCQVSAALTGDALWIDLCAQLRADGARLVWTPDVSFVMPAIYKIDADNTARTGSPAAQALPWADPYHHPALSLHGDLLAAEKRTGLVRATPSGPASLLLTGDGTATHCVLNAARALRQEGVLDVDWVPGLPTTAEINRRAPADWVQINPSQPSGPACLAYTAVYTTEVKPEALDALVGARAIFATSPDLVKHIRALAPKKTPVTLWRPALSGHLWRNFQAGTGLNTKPRILWIDEGFSPSWLQELIAETVDQAAWMILPRADASYGEGVTLLPQQTTEPGWVELLTATAPQILLRPAETATYTDCYPSLLAAAAGCRLIIDSRLDAPDSLGALRLPNQKKSWTAALTEAITDLAGTLQRGAKTRTAALALPSVEQAPPGWINSSLISKSEPA